MTNEHKNSVPTSLDLDPIAADRSLSDAIDSLLTGDKDREGRSILTFAPNAKLRAQLQIRLEKLQTQILPARGVDLARTVAQMLLGFGSARATEDDAQAVVTQYVTVLSHLPLWAVERACRRFASGSVTKAESPDWQRAYPPSTAQLCYVAESFVHGYWREERRINDILNGTPAYSPTKVERERVSKGLVEFAKTIASKRKQQSRPLQPIGPSVSLALKQALRESEEIDRIARDGVGECK